MNAFRDARLSLGQFSPGAGGTLTDVPGVLVGHRTIVHGAGANAIRTGVTAILPPGDPYAEPLPAGAFVLHGHGKALGLWQVLHLGELETPILLTNTLAVPRCADALLTWTLTQHPSARSVNPLVLECNDGRLSAIEARPVTEGDALAALGAGAEHVEEGCVGAGTGMVAFGFKSGIGTASRVVGSFTVGSLALPNMGRREDLRPPPGLPAPARASPPDPQGETGSLIVVLATNAPLSPAQLSRLARRASLGAARTGAPADTGSGDFTVAFSTGWRIPRGAERIPGEFIADRSPTMGGLYRAAAEAAEEAIYSALLASTPLAGRDGQTVPTLTHP
ncbi:MAG: P1 family peptidase [Candidatus Bipolaricaulis sp.]|nr:P1 family peptidase [Candidatus Bipolaricaulis sp.]